MIPLHELVRRISADTGHDVETINTITKSLISHIRLALVHDGTVRLNGLGLIRVFHRKVSGNKNLTFNKKAGRKKLSVEGVTQFSVFFKKAPTLSALLKKEHGDRHAER